MQKLHVIQNLAARLVIGARKFDRVGRQSDNASLSSWTSWPTTARHSATLSLSLICVDIISRQSFTAALLFDERAPRATDSHMCTATEHCRGRPSSVQRRSAGTHQYQYSMSITHLQLPTIYSKPNSVFLDEFNSFLSLAATTPHEFIITGDFNIHVDNCTNHFTSEFLSLLSSFNLTQHVHFPTHEQTTLLTQS